MKQLIIQTVCTATVFETWHVNVPDDWDDEPRPIEDLNSWLLETIEQFDSTCVSEDVQDERDREVRSFLQRVQQ